MQVTSPKHKRPSAGSWHYDHDSVSVHATLVWRFVVRHVHTWFPTLRNEISCLNASSYFLHVCGVALWCFCSSFTPGVHYSFLVESLVWCVMLQCRRETRMLSCISSRAGGSLLKGRNWKVCSAVAVEHYHLSFVTWLSCHIHPSHDLIHRSDFRIEEKRSEN